MHKVIVFNKKTHQPKLHETGKKSNPIIYLGVSYTTATNPTICHQLLQ